LPTATDIATCRSCGAKNRLKAPPTGQLPACGRCGADLPWLVNTSDATFAADIDAAVPVLVDFWAAWCGPCRMVAPVLEELSGELAGRLKVVKLDVDANPVTSNRFGVRSIPLLFKGGEVAGQSVGAMPKGPLLAERQPHRGAASATR
jgi:thioredoxin 2